MANLETGSKQVREGLKKGTDILTNLFDSVKKTVSSSGYSASKPVKGSDGTIEIKAGEKNAKISKSLPKRIMNSKFFFPSLIIGGLLFVVFRRLK